MCSSLIVPTFVTKVTENLFSGWVSFLQTNFDVLTKKFWRIFFISAESILVLSSIFKRSFTCDDFSASYECSKIANIVKLGQLTRDIFRDFNA